MRDRNFKDPGLYFPPRDRVTDERGAIPGRDYGIDREYFSKKIAITIPSGGLGGDIVLPETLIYTTRRPHATCDVYAFSPIDPPSAFETVVKVYAVNGDVRTLLDSGRLVYAQGAGTGPVNQTATLTSDWIVSVSATCERYDVTLTIYKVIGVIFVEGEGAPKVEWAVSLMAHGRDAGGDNDSRGIRLWTPNTLASGFVITPSRSDVAIARPLLQHVYGTNNHATNTRYFQLVNVVPGGAVAGLPAIAQLLIPPLGNFSYAPPQHWRDDLFASGLTWVVSTTKDVVTEDVAGDFSVFVAYK